MTKERLIPNLKKSLKDMKLSYKLIISNIIVVIIPVLILGTISYNNFADQTTRQFTKDVRSQLEQRISQVTEKISSIESFSSNLSFSYFINQFLNGNFTTDYDSLIDYSLIEKYIISLTASNKSLINSVNIFYTNSSIPEKWPIFYHIDRLDRSYKEKYELETQNQKWLVHDNTTLKGMQFKKEYFFKDNEITFIKPIISDTSFNAIGFIKVTALKQNIFSAIDNPAKSDIYFMVTDLEGNVIYDPNRIASQIDSSVFTAAPDSYTKLNMGSVVQMKLLPSLNVRIIAKATIPKTFNNVKEASLNFLWVIVVSVLISCIAVYLIVRLLFKKMKTMLRVMKAVSDGDFSRRVNIDSRDEMGVLASNFNYMIDNVVDLKEKLVGRERLQKQAEINALQSQINPHFIYNTLEIFKSKLELKNEFEVANSIYSLGKMLRYSTNWSRESTIEEELNHLNNYIKLQKIHLEDRLHVFINCSREYYGCKVIKLILQPLVENSIVHGKSEGSSLNIEVNIYHDGSLLVIEVFDDGSGIPEGRLGQIRNTLTESIDDKNSSNKRESAKSLNLSSIGLKNINERIKLSLGEEYGIIVESESEVYTKVSAVLPFILEDN